MNVEVIECPSIEDLLTRLDPARNEWSEWVFRGQPDDALELIPSVWRAELEPLFNIFLERVNEESILKFVNEINIEDLNKEFIKNWIIRTKFENFLLSNFYDISNRAGLKIPEQDLRLSNGYKETYWIADNVSWFPFKEAIKNYLDWKKRSQNIFSYGGCPACFDQALPQHHGLPTRVLDWTNDPRKAIFFGAYYFLTNHRHRDATNIAIYAYKHIKNGPVEILNAYARFENIFLHSQGALFTRINGDFIFIENGRWPSVDDIFNTFGNTFFELKKFIISVKFCKEILVKLQACNISISTMMPSYNHVAEQVLKTIF